MTLIKTSKDRLHELSDQGLLKWKGTLTITESEENSTHYGGDAERVDSPWRPTLNEVNEEINRREKLKSESE